MLSTLEILELEKKVFKYRLKKRIPYLIVLLLCLILSGIALFFYLKPSHTITVEEKQPALTPIPSTSSAIETNLSINQNASSSSHVLTKQEHQNDNTKAEEKTLFLQLPTISKNNIGKKNSSLLEQPENPKNTLSTEIEEPENRVLSSKSMKVPDENFYRTKEDKIDTLLLPPPLTEEEKPKGIIKIESQEVNSIKYLKERFEKSHNIIFALMLSEEYYIAKNYQDSNKWSIVANTIDADNEKSWILFAKSKLKLGQKQDAIASLEAYLKHNKSKAAQSLLTQILSGESID